MGQLLSVVGLLFLIGLVILGWRRRGRRASVGPGAAGAVYELLNEDKRAAIEIILEERAAYRDPEDRDGDLPKLTGRPKKNG